MKIWVKELVHGNIVGVGVAVAAPGTKMFYANVLILEYQQRKNVVVMTIFYLPRCHLHQVFADQTSWGNLSLVPSQQQRNL